MIIALSGAFRIFFFEHSLNEDQFGSLGDRIWWVLVTMPTVGYGDRVSVTPAEMLMQDKDFVILLKGRE